MELSVSSPKQSVLSPPECMSDPEEQEISEEEDDDRNHKHRRREARSQSLERDSSDQVFARPYRKNNRHFENGNSFTEYERRRPGALSAQRVHFDSNQRIRSNQAFPGDSGPGRGRGRDYGSWNQRDSRFNPVDLSSRMVQVGSMASSIFGGRGLSGVSTPQGAPWRTFGMLPGVPNGGLDTLHPIGFQGALRPALNSPLNVGIPRQRCRDFEERGFCLRGDMCPMEHGINRIVVDDVQSLSQFNLPVSLAGAPLAAPSKSVPVHVGSSSTFMNTKGVNGKNNKGGMTNDGLGYGDAYPGAVGTEFYDPDQPLWNNNAGEISGAISGLNSQGIDETVALLDDDNHDGADNECGIRNSKSTSQSVWGRICASSTQANAREKSDAALNLSSGLENQIKEISTSSSRQVKRSLAGETVAKVIDSSSKAPNDATHNIRKPTQKALRTLFVNGVPRESNRRELLLAHFQKFGKVIDIHIPINSERAFVQFSKREEAEAALKAPDAVMGNRFIKLWWANRDNIPDNSLSMGNGGSMTARGMIAAGVQNQFPIAMTSKGNLVSAASKGSVLQTAEGPSSSDQPKPVVSKVPPAQNKKAEALEQLKEELRKKREMLEQKRNEFRKQLAKLEKHATVVKSEEADEQAAKRLKADTAADLSRAPSNRSSDPGVATASLNCESPKDKSKPTQKLTPLQESKNLKQRTRPFATTMNTPMVNRYKLDNRTTTIRVVPPLPTGLADVAVLKEHFSSYGEVSNVELEGEEPSDSSKDSDTPKTRAARVTFAKRGAAEKAIANAKCWQGHVLQLVWVTRSSKESNNPSVSNDPGCAEKSSVSNASTTAENPCISNVKESSEEATDVEPAEESWNKNSHPQDKNVPENDDASEKQENDQRNESTKLLGALQTSAAMETGEEESEEAADAC